MARCEQCSKFVSYEGDEEPEVDDASVEDDGCYSASATLYKRCAECSSDLRTTSFETEGQIDEEWVEAHPPGDQGYSIEVEDLCQTEEGGGRYAKSYYGISANIVVTAPDGETWSEMWDDKCAASYMDEC